jgi:hypothetical protein
MNLAATLIAGFGLLENSPAVISIPATIGFLGLAPRPCFSPERDSPARQRTDDFTDLQKSLATGVARIPGARLAQVTLAPQQGKTDVWAVVRTPQPLSPEEVGRLNDLVNRVVGTLRWPHGEVRNYGRNDARRRCLRAPGFSG